MIKHVLFLDDSEIYNAILGKYAKKHKVSSLCKVDIVTDPLATIRICKKIKIDLLVIDIHLGAVNGFDVIESVKSMSKDTEIWTFSAMSEEYIYDERKVLCKKILHKDIGIQSMLNNVREFIDDQ